jgi:outer membrane protein OmpA-like peptidoglycan-associated protein
MLIWYLYINYNIMIPQNWIITESEKSRILSLHLESTKNQYLINEQVERKSWNLCQYTIIQDGDRYYLEVSANETIEIPTTDQIGGTLVRDQSKKGLVFDYNDLTKKSISAGRLMKRTFQCANLFPEIGSRSSSPIWFCAFDLKSDLPVYGQISSIGNIGTAQSPNIEVVKEKEGSLIMYQKTRTDKYIIELSIATKGKITGSTTIPPKTPETTIPHQFNIESPFEFDKTSLTPESEIKFKEFLEIIKNRYNNVRGDVTVTTSASIDTDPNKTEDYNMKLSTNRANEIINRIKRETGNQTLNFIPNPIGQTDKFKPGYKWPEFTNKNDTAPNRRLIINLPKID